MNLGVLFENQKTAEEAAELFKNRGIAERISEFYSPEKPAAIGFGGENGPTYVRVMPWIMRGKNDPTYRENDRKALYDRVYAVPENEDCVLVRNYEELGYVKQSGFTGRVITDTSLYAFNKEALMALKDAGSDMDTVPLELNIHEMRGRGVSGSVLVAYGRTPLMISAQCIYRTKNGKCGKNLENGRAEILVDRMNVKFPAVMDCRACYNVIYNSVPLSLHGEMDRILDMDIYGIRLDFTTERAEEAADITELYLNLLSGRSFDQSEISRLVPHFTKGHFRKGVE